VHTLKPGRDLMPSLIKNFLLLLVLLVTITYGQTRFRDIVFTTPEISKNIIFGTGLNYLGTTDTLVLDFYQPANDTMTKRPLIILIHGGGFTSGTHDDGWCVAIGTKLALKGYACASIKYRLGIDLVKVLTDLSAARAQYVSALYRALQDSRSAVRFLKSNSSIYNIDTSKVFLCGYSAGAITAVHYVHMQANELALTDDTTGLGPLDIGENLNISTSVAGYISYAGAISDTSYINAGEQPFLAFHGTGDEVVPYDAGPAYGIQLMPVIFGSSVIQRVANRVNINNKLVTYPDSSHMFAASPTLLPQTIDTVSEFLYTNFFGTSRVKSIAMIKHMSFFPLSVNPFTITGRLVQGTIKPCNGVYIKRVLQNNKRPVSIVK
jgi:acetyl esterase/lipase